MILTMFRRWTGVATMHCARTEPAGILHALDRIGR
jgi:hypothetical protein